MKVPLCFAYGVAPKLGQNVANCLRDKPVGYKYDRLKQCIAHVNTVRTYLGRKKEPLPFEDIKDMLTYLDKDKSGMLPFDIVCRFLKRYNVLLERSLIVFLMDHLGDVLPVCQEALDKKVSFNICFQLSKCTFINLYYLLTGSRRTKSTKKEPKHKEGICIPMSTRRCRLQYCDDRLQKTCRFN